MVAPSCDPLDEVMNPTERNQVICGPESRGPALSIDQ